LRGIAILLVLAYHFTPFTGPLFRLAHLFQFGWTGVDLFFILSGYLITGILVDSVGQPSFYRNFIVRRSLRIFPLYYACLALYFVLTYYQSAIHLRDVLYLREGWWYIAYLGNIKLCLDGHWPSAGFLTPLWSLQVEEQFYLTFPLLVALSTRRTLKIVLASSVIIALVLRTVAVFAWPQNLLPAYVLMPCRMDSLAMGGLIALASRESAPWLKSHWLGWITALSAIVFITDDLWSQGSLWTRSMRTIGYSALDLAFAGLLVMLIHWRQPALLALFRLRFLVWIGTISYGMYILHIPAANVVKRFAPQFGIASGGSAESLACFAAAILAAWISWAVFESPILRLKNRLTVAR
jgi:peptidoglycan/LPS O-acetylase OafA/YrhL